MPRVVPADISSVKLLLALHLPDWGASIEAVHVSGAQGGLTLRRTLAHTIFLTKSLRSQAILTLQRQSVINLMEVRDDTLIIALSGMIFRDRAVCTRGGAESPQLRTLLGLGLYLDLVFPRRIRRQFCPGPIYLAEFRNVRYQVALEISC